ncbi:CAP domain-containing protein [Halomonas sp. WWR20]
MIFTVRRFSLSLITLVLFGFAGSSQASTPATEEAPVNDRILESECEPNEIQRTLLERINEARSRARQCGDETFEAVEPLTWNCKLEAAAEAHSSAMAEHDFFSHTGPDGEEVGERVNARGYDWTAVGENIAAGQASVAAVVDGWLASPGHCANIMNGKFTEMGAASVEQADSKYSPYWTQVLARPVTQ